MIYSRRTFSKVALAALPLSATARAASQTDKIRAKFPLQVSENKRYLVDRAGKPFFLNGDSAWEIDWQLNREETESYLKRRCEQGFNALGVDAIPYSEWSNHVTQTDREGNAAFIKEGDFATPNEAYFKRLGWLLAQAEQKGMLVLLIAADLGSNGIKAAQFGADGGMWYRQYKSNGPEKCYEYGRYLGRRFRKFDNILWLVGGDRDPGDVTQHVLAMARGLEETAPEQLKTYHAGAKSSGVFFQKEPWLDVDMAYGYSNPYIFVSEEYKRQRTKPVFLGESGYEGESIDKRGGTPLRVRRQAYWGVLSGAFGNMYGSRTWTFTAGWKDWLEAPAANQMKYFQDFFCSHKWYELKPDFDHQILTGGYGEGTEMATAAATADGSFAALYMPSARKVTLNLAKLGREPKATWFNPTTGESRSVPEAETGTGTKGQATFTPPKKIYDSDSDWILVVLASH